jgi:hypothetical protein
MGSVQGFCMYTIALCLYRPVAIMLCIIGDAQIP